MLEFLKKLCQQIKELSPIARFLSFGAGAVVGGFLAVLGLIAMGAPFTGALLLLSLGVAMIITIGGGLFGVALAASAKDFYKEYCSNNESTSSNDQTNTERVSNNPGNENNNSYQQISSHTAKSQSATPNVGTESSHLLNTRSSSESRGSILPAFITNIGTWFQRRLGIIPPNEANNVFRSIPKHPGL